jgi:two-component system, NtrC family, sensor kinase
MAASLVFPLALFALMGWRNYQSVRSLADERISRSLDLQQQEAVKAFQLVDLTLRDLDGLLSGMSESQIRDNAERLHESVKKLVADIPEIQSIWVYDKDGFAVASSVVQPPPSQNYADRDFFRMHLGTDAGTYYGQVYNSQFNGKPYFTVSRRFDRDGVFAGVEEVSVLPSNFMQFYTTMAYGAGLQYAMVRQDGKFLTRYPALQLGETDQLDEHTGFRRIIAQNPAGGFYESTSPVDHIERRYGIRRFGSTPIYFSAGIDKSMLRWEWLGDIFPYLALGAPAALIVFLTLAAVLQRTKRLYVEVDRRVAAEEGLRQSQKLDAIGQLTGGVAHDFNNLLTIIIGNLEGAQRQLESWTEGAQVKLSRRVDNAMHGAQRAATLTKRLLAFARQQPLNPTIIDVNRLVSGLGEFIRRTIGEDISFEVVGSGGLWPIEADAAELEAAILNLAVNARDAMEGGGQLTIETSNAFLDEAYCQQRTDVQAGQYVLIAVTDTGAGMKKEILDRAFEPFFTTKPSGHGTGLGLSQVYGFAKQSGGHVQIYSELGEGTTVKLYLRRFTGMPVEPTKTENVPAVGGHPGECILVVEDDADVRGYVVETLGGLGYDVLQAATGDEALRLIDEYKSIRLLLTDVVMPGMNGRQLAEQATQRRPSLKILFMTGYSRNAIVHQGRLDPGVELIQKPLTAQHLGSKVRQALEQ